MAEAHLPVLKTEVLTALALKPNQKTIDCTLGAGGHAEAILQQTGPHGQLLGLDVDPEALQLARARLSRFGERVRLVQTNFDQVAQIATENDFSPVLGMIADLGVSSMQLDQPQRGFSFRQAGPLDMRMGPEVAETAAMLVNTLAETDLADLIYRYGEERKSRPIARAIVKARPIETTEALAAVIQQVLGRRPGQRIDPATRTFQALRIAVNDELGVLERFLPQAISLLAPGGRLAVITFHSLEDRIVKRYFQQEASDCICPPEQLVCTCNHRATVKIVNRKPLVAEETEIELNPRARSAKLRVVESLN